MMTSDEKPDEKAPFEADLNRTHVIPVIEERIQVEKEWVEKGRVRISKRVVEEEQTISTPILSEQVNVERVAVGEFVDSLPDVRYEGNTMIIPVVEEVLVVQKRIRLVEELRVTRRQTEKESTERVVVRKEEITVERLKSDDPIE